jgi:hypothetical protein
LHAPNLYHSNNVPYWSLGDAHASSSRVRGPRVPLAQEQVEFRLLGHRCARRARRRRATAFVAFAVIRPGDAGPLLNFTMSR